MNVHAYRDQFIQDWPATLPHRHDRVDVGLALALDQAPHEHLRSADLEVVDEVKYAHQRLKPKDG